MFSILRLYDPSYSMEYTALQNYINKFQYNEVCGGYCFRLLEVGQFCNGMDSRSFSDAACDLADIKCGVSVASYSMKSLFRSGFALLDRIGQKCTTTSELETQTTALNQLEKFLRETDEQGEKLKNVFLDSPAERRKEHITETDISMALSEHLLGKLSGGKAYLDISSRKKGICKCGCGAKSTFDYTGMGHEKVWHGFTDIVVTAVPDCTVPVVVTEDGDAPACTSSAGFVTPMKKRKKSHEEGDGSEEEENDEESPGGKCIAEVKDVLQDAEDQAVSQAIVFSFIQRSRHPDYSNHLIPTIAISPSSFTIIMYDSQNDILLCLNESSLFEGNELSIPSVIILWLVLNYKLFCNGIDIKKIPPKIDYRSKFQDRVSECLPIYREKLKWEVTKFPRTKKKFTFKRQTENAFLID